MTEVVARHIHWMWSCSLLDELGVRVPCGDAEEWLAPTPAHLLAEVARVVQLPEDCTTRLAQDIAHWMLASGGASGEYDKPEGLPNWEFEGYTIGDDGVVDLGGVPLGSVEAVTGDAEWFTPEDYAHLREKLLEIWPVGDDGGTDGPQDVMTSRGYVTLHPDGDVVQQGWNLMRVILPDWEVTLNKHGRDNQHDYDRGRADERAAVVAWLRRNPGVSRAAECITAMTPFECADAIENGGHLH